MDKGKNETMMMTTEIEIESSTINRQLCNEKINLEQKSKTSKATIDRVKPMKQCTVCEKRFNSAPALSRHRMRIHKIEPKKLFVCPLCKVNAKNRYFYREHLLAVHAIKLHEERFVFDLFQDFLDWKDRMERETSTYFIRSRRISAHDRYGEYFNCNRTGPNPNSCTTSSSPSSESNNEIKSNLEIETDEEERTKDFGAKNKCGGKSLRRISRKVGGLCPAKINLNFDQRRKGFIVHYCGTHVGHALDDRNHSVRAQKRARVKSARIFTGQVADEVKVVKEKKDASNLARSRQLSETKIYQDSEIPAAIESITIDCAMGCSTPTACPHIGEQTSFELDVRDLRNAPPDVIETLIRQYGSTLRPDGHQIVSIIPSTSALLDSSTLMNLRIDASEQEQILQSDKHLISANQANHQMERIDRKDTMKQDEASCGDHPIQSTANAERNLTISVRQAQQMEQIFRKILLRVNDCTADFVTAQLRQLAGTLDTLENYSSYLVCNAKNGDLDSATAAVLPSKDDHHHNHNNQKQMSLLNVSIN